LFRLFIVFFLHVSLLFAANNSEILKRADKLTKSPSKTKIFRAYNDYKNVYLRSVMHSNLDERKSALHGIIISGKKLHIDVEKYQKELNSLKKSSKKREKTALKMKNIKKTSSSKKIKVMHYTSLKQVRWDDESLILDFDRKLLKTDVNYFKLIDKKRSSFRYIFDIHAVKNKNIKLQHTKLKSIRISQYKHNIVRLVFESKRKLNLRFKLEGKHLYVFLHLGSSAPLESQAKYKLKTKAKKRVVVIDPGHGGKDNGATGYKNCREKNIVLQVAQAVTKQLRKRGITVYLTRTQDKFIKLRNRTKYANKKKADIFISIHANSVPKKNALKAKGLETYFLSRSRSSRATRVAAVENSKEIEDMNYFGKNNLLNFMNREKIIASNKLAIDVQKGMLSSLRKHYKDVKDNGVREGPFWVLVGAQMPAVLLEIGFVSNPTEASRMLTKKYQKYLAKGIAEGIERYFIKNP